MDRMACIDLPAFPLQLLLRRHPEWREHPAAVVDADKPQGVILWVNEHARSMRIRPGMRYAAGLSLAPTSSKRSTYRRSPSSTSSGRSTAGGIGKTSRVRLKGS